MKADKSAMFAVRIEDIDATEGQPFPLFILLERNDRFVPIRGPGDPLGTEKCNLFLKKAKTELWVPNKFKQIFEAYLSALTIKGRAGKSDTHAEKKPAHGAKAKSELENEWTEDGEVVRDIIEDKELTPKEKAEILSELSQDALRALSQITTRGEEAREMGMKRCNEIASQFLVVAARSSDIYQEILDLRSSQEEISHSVITGTVAVMFAMTMGIADERLLADMGAAAIFHDIGLVKVNPEIMIKNETSWSADERGEYQKHVEFSKDILEESGAKFHPRIFRMIAEHHENYDGSGFPRGLKGFQIQEASQILHLANKFDRLCVGKETGKEMSPAEAFDFIYSEAQSGQRLEIKPELIERIFQFMLNERAAAEELRAVKAPSARPR